VVAFKQCAIDEIIKIAKDSGFEEPYCIRAGVKGDGCSGFSYDLQIIDKDSVKEDDVTEQQGNLTIAVDPKSNLYLEGVIVSYESSLKVGNGFIFDNPNAQRQCGCGKSFEV